MARRHAGQAPSVIDTTLGQHDDRGPEDASPGPLSRASSQDGGTGLSDDPRQGRDASLERLTSGAAEPGG
jgi:hypothetical protein